MKHLSTRGLAPHLSFDDIVLSGLAPDGGLYVPEVWPQLSPKQFNDFADQRYGQVAEAVLSALGGSETALDLNGAIAGAYAQFRHPEVAPLRPLAPNLWMLELFHGPTFAFKDFALQLLGPLMAQRLERESRRLTVLAATSGDTGSAAIAALAGRPNLDIVVLHPKGRVSEIQRRQMTTVMAPNVHNIALEGDFDTAQALVKALFADRNLSAQMQLSAVNSINWARLAAQTVYFITACAALRGRGPVTFVVPTGNFGDIFSGYAAKKMGAPIARLIAATNSNDIVARALTTGRYERRTVTPTHSPSMDIQVASNFERLLFDASGRNPTQTMALMEEFAQTGAFTVPSPVLTEMQATFGAFAADETQTFAAIRRVHESTGMVVDPHTATGVAAAFAQDLTERGPVVCLATAHPAKFEAAIHASLGFAPDIPAELSALKTLPERCVDLPADINALKDYLLTVVQQRGAL
ncbi:MAG TPA: threonine synthase [Alphaproteobacteria bacterium]|nr:threonine synthase [Alphaproteobacteria bacterium]